MNGLTTPQLSRRNLLKTSLSAIAATFSPSVLSDKRQWDKDALYLAGAKNSDGQYLAAVMDEQANILATIPLSARAHGAASHRSSNQACLFARRPGNYAHTFDMRNPERSKIIANHPERRFYGHGAYSEDGKLLFATENDFDAGKGILGIYEPAKNYQRIAEIDTGGVGPHDVVQVPGSPLLVVANGGIQTHPDTGREKLNIETMRPSISLINSQSGRLVGKHFLPEAMHQVSIRHLAVAGNDKVWFAGQYQGSLPVVEGLAGVISIQASIDSYRSGFSTLGLSIVDLPGSLQSRMNHYLSSVAITAHHALFTSSKGGITFAVDRSTHKLSMSLSMLDCSGIAPLHNASTADATTTNRATGALITSGTGEVAVLSDDQLKTLSIHKLQWDNHVYAV